MPLIRSDARLFFLKKVKQSRDGWLKTNHKATRSYLAWSRQSEYINIISEHVYVAAASFFQVHSSVLVKIYSVYCPCYTREVSCGTKFALTRTLCCYFELRKLVCSEDGVQSFFIYLPNNIETRPFALLQCLAFVPLLTDITEAAEFLSVEDVFTNLPFNLYRNLLFLPEFFSP